MTTARAHNGDDIYLEVHGDGPAVLLGNPLDPCAPDSPMTDRIMEMQEALVNGLADRYRVVLMSYPGPPKRDSLIPDNVTNDLLAIADAAGADRFAWWGYSWGGVIGLQLAVRTDRLTALAMTGFPPLDGPYQEMLRSCQTLRDSDASAFGMGMAAEIRDQHHQFVTYYEHLQDFDDRAAQRSVSCPKLCLVGADDEVTVGTEIVTHHGDTVAGRKGELEELGWEVEVITGLDHITTFQPEIVLPRLSTFFDHHLQHGGYDDPK